MTKEHKKQPVMKKFIKVNAPGILQIRNNGRVMVFMSGSLVEYDVAPEGLKKILHNKVTNVTRGKNGKKIKKVELVERIFDPNTGKVVEGLGERYVAIKAASVIQSVPQQKAFDAIKEDSGIIKEDSGVTIVAEDVNDEYEDEFDGEDDADDEDEIDDEDED